ncbi:hypothetical protein BH11BAC7_BH11BAC7_00770 [soil metagenome]
MATFTDRPDRLVLPKWREFKKTASAKELSSYRLDISKPKKQDITAQTKNWENSPSFLTASELVNSAFIAGDLDSAKSAATFILERCPTASKSIVQIATIIVNPFGDSLKPNKNKEAFSFDNIQRRIGEKIKETRISLRIFPNNAVRWIDLARLYTVIGKFENAEKAVKAALHLAGNNVFIIRSAVRFFIHMGSEENYKYALSLIRKNPSTKHDPWLLATEISLCAYLKKSSNLIKYGLQMISSKNYSPFSTSELASAIATEELRNGGTKARSFFNAALCDPNENALAQAEWARKHIGNLPLDFDKQDSSEALSYVHFHSGNWEAAYENAMDWIFDQPFSKESFKHASYISSGILDDNEKSLEICDFGLRSNPEDFGLINNKAYALAVLGRVEEAKKTFSQVSGNSITDAEKIAYNATQGLIYYRMGVSELGEQHYSIAVDLAVKSRDKEKTILVRAYKMRAEFLSGFNKVDKSVGIETIKKQSENLLRPDAKKILENLCNRISGENKTIKFDEQNKPDYIVK